MYGRKISIAELSTVENYKYEAYNDIEFELYTQKNPEVHQRVLIDDPSSLHNSNFNPLHPTRILIHGCCTNGSSESIQYPRAGYMKKGEFNVFGVNWSKGAEIFPNFLTYGRRMRSTGEVVAQFIDFLIRDGNASMQDMGVIGHSAGAIVVSFVGTATNSTLAVQIKGFWAKRCKNFEGISNGKCDPEGSVTVYKKMGGEPVDTTEGMFYLKTADKYPFAQGWIS
uniref:CSON003612 protein n=1 Tax=Culicoides sonorensis TaxID=179676 RepID=A0A336MMA5_CULSO